MKFFAAILLLGFTALPCHDSSAQVSSNNEQQYISLLQLISTPERFDGKKVVVTGFLQLGPEQSLLYLHEQDNTHGILENAVQIRSTSQMRNDKEELNLKYVRIAGVFKAADRKKSPFSSGTIGSIESCRFWSDPAHPMKQRLQEMQGK